MNDEVLLKNKYDVLIDLIKDIEVRKDKHFQKYKHLRNISSIFDVTNSVLGATTISSIFLTLSSMNPAVLIAGASISSVAFVIQSGRMAYKLEDKVNRYHVSQSQYAILIRNSNLILARNNLSNEDVLELISDINQQLSIIEDSALD